MPLTGAAAKATGGPQGGNTSILSGSEIGAYPSLPQVIRVMTLP